MWFKLTPFSAPSTTDSASRFQHLREPRIAVPRYGAERNASTLTPAWSISPRSVPGLIGLCIGTTTVLLSLRRMT